jgi:hypothetical protein
LNAVARDRSRFQSTVAESAIRIDLDIPFSFSFSN